MRLGEITDKQTWESFLSAVSEKTFLQSWNWGECNKKMGNTCWRFGVYENSQLLAVALVIKVAAKRGTFLFIPHGPIVGVDLQAANVKEIFQILFLQLKAVAKEEGASFVRVAPLFLRTAENEQIFTEAGFRKSPIHASAYEATWKLSLDLPEEKLLSGMRKTTRYLIKKALENPDIAVETSSSVQDVAAYQLLNKEVSRRQQFVGFSNAAIQNEFDVFHQDREALMFFGTYKGEKVAGAMIIFWQGIAFYHQAASLGKFAKFSVPYLLQWEAIKEAKRRGCQLYDFWGFTDPQKFPGHPWAGPTLFKMGFGGFAKEYIETQDLKISQKYWLSYIIESIRRKKRGL